MKRIFRCQKGHEYESKEPITTGYFEAVISPRLRSKYRAKANDSCKICNSPIMSETNYVNGKPISGAIRCGA